MASELDLYFKDVIAQLETRGKSEWLTLYSGSERAGLEWGSWYSALIPEEATSRSLDDAAWDISIGDGAPGIEQRFDCEEREWDYVRSADDGIEPLAIRRTFMELKPSGWEIAEDFRLFWNLYEDRSKGLFVHIDQDGNEHEVASIAADSIRVKLSYVKKYISARRMQLALLFDLHRFSTKTLKELGLEPSHVDGATEVSKYAHSISDYHDGEKKSHARLIGKVLVGAVPGFTPDMLDDHKNKTFEEFKIGLDEHGNDVLHSCDESLLANSFGANSGAPHFLTPVQFDRAVLDKYYGDPDKYSVGDGGVSCGALWTLPVDNNQRDVVMVYLGDLGRLSHKEQLHWKHHNVPGKAKLSSTAYARDLQAQFTDPERPDLFFKQRFEAFCRDWKRKFGWSLFLPLASGDAHHMASLHSPSANDQKAFDEQILSLTKIFVDSLNEAELAKGLTLPRDAKGIDKLEAFLDSQHVKFVGLIEFMRDLQSLRSSGVAHRKGGRYDKARAPFRMDEQDLREVCDEILISCIKVLNSLASRVLHITPVDTPGPDEQDKAGVR
jgi:hypothetical protein